jgi:hypothetical protein
MIVQVIQYGHRSQCSHENPFRRVLDFRSYVYTSLKQPYLSQDTFFVDSYPAGKIPRFWPRVYYLNHFLDLC